MDEDTKVLLKIIDAIGKRLDSIEDNLGWLVHADQRGFKVGQRVKFTERAIRKGLAHRRKGGVTQGTIKAIGDLYSITVLLDGYKKPRSFHHSLFEEVWR